MDWRKLFALLIGMTLSSGSIIAVYLATQAAEAANKETVFCFNLDVQLNDNQRYCDLLINETYSDIKAMCIDEYEAKCMAPDGRQP